MIPDRGGGGGTRGQGGGDRGHRPTEKNVFLPLPSAQVAISFACLSFRCLRFVRRRWAWAGGVTALALGIVLRV
jgi:hypothetical protein